MATQLKLGKTPARPEAVKLKLTDYSTLPISPKTFGHQSDVTSWQMLGNDKYGDCVFAGAGHETMLWNKEASKTVLFSDSSVLSDYSAVTGFNPNDPNTDQGTDMQVAASYRLKTGVKDASGQRHQIGAYLAITPGNVAEVKSATYLFSAVGIGIKFPASAMTQFNAGKPWTVVSSSPIEGGHYVPCVGYNTKYLYIVTWGKLQKMSLGFLRKYMDEGVAYLSEEFLKLGVGPEGFDLTTLRNDLAQLK